MSGDVLRSAGQSFSSKNILSILPHRYPFLLIDAIVSLDLIEKTVIAKKNVTINEPYFEGHFPDAPLMPGVLVIEAMAQTGGVLVHEIDGPGRIAILLGVQEAKFRKPVKPGDQLILKAKLIHLSSKAGKVHAEAYVDDILVAEAQMSFALIQKEQI
jgi:3-hydroxyacyl-[acyl-carrier-protein] dehydratase